MKNRAPVIGITAGDPAGIGPEVALKAIHELSGEDLRIVLICRHEVIGTLYSPYYHDYRIVSDPGGTAGTAHPRILLDVPAQYPIPAPGKGSADTGAESRLYIDTALDLWKAGLVDAVVTAPVSKGLINRSGVPFMGHTEYMAEAIGETAPYMMMYSRDYRVILASTHLSLAAVPGYLHLDRLVRVIETAHRSLTVIDGKPPRIAVAGLDPHCGDEGAIGEFDMTVTARAVALARERGIDAEGPFAADTLFVPDKWRRYGCAVALYHDQGLIPFKMVSFETGVNVTLGLSLVRTSPDHGTAFDIAGQGTADHRSMTEAIRLALRLAELKRREIA